MTAKEAKVHLGYSAWAAEKLMEAAAALPAGVAAKEWGVSHKSIEATLGHCYVAERIWLARVAGGPGTGVPTDGEGPFDLAFLAREWPAVKMGWLRWAESVSDFDALCAYRNLKGDPYETPLGHIVNHVVNHGSVHAGQVTAMLRQAGVVPPDIDLIVYYRVVA